MVGFNRITDWIDSTVFRYTSDISKHKQAKVILRGGLITALFMANYMALSYFIDFEVGKNTMPVLTLLFALLPILFYFKIHIIVIGNVFPLLGFINGVILVHYTGGLNSPVLPWVALVPIIALLFINRTWSWIWCFITVVYDLWLGYASRKGYDFPIGYNQEYENFFYTNCAIGLVFIFLILNLVFEYSLTKANQELETKNKQIELQHKLLFEEKEKSDNLLLNILPKEIANEMKETGSTIAKQYNNVTIIFMDFVDFTVISKKMNPKELVAEIDYCFTNYDTIMSELGVEKIRTIGDAYLAACGVPNYDKDHAVKVIQAAIRVNEFMASYQLERRVGMKPYFDVRIGINTGPIVAGVVGKNKFVYDIWGDSVNVAARMEQNGIAGKINISKTTYDLSKNYFSFEYRGKIEAKNMGPVDMYFVQKNSISTS